MKDKRRISNSAAIAMMMAACISMTSFAGQWEASGEDWRYKNDNGDYATGWQWIDGKSYYFGEDGTMAKDTSVDGRQLNADGQWIADGEVQEYTCADDSEREQFTQGWNCDLRGNLYYVDGKEGIIRDGTNSDGLYFNSDGIYISPSYDPDGTKKELAEKFSEGERVTFETESDLADFWDYWDLQEMLNANTDSCKRTTNADGTYSLKIPDEKSYCYDKIALKDKIVEKFESGPWAEAKLTGENVSDKVLTACGLIWSKLSYDLNYSNVSMENALDDGRGVCWHYARAAKVLLEDAGIYTETMAVTTNLLSSDKTSGNLHMIIRCWDGEKWIYSDPTIMWDNIPYKDFVKYYNVKRIAR